MRRKKAALKSESRYQKSRSRDDVTPRSRKILRQGDDAGRRGRQELNLLAHDANPFGLGTGICAEGEPSVALRTSLQQTRRSSFASPEGFVL
jgi:hypothetical protein